MTSILANCGTRVDRCPDGGLPVAGAARRDLRPHSRSVSPGGTRLLSSRYPSGDGQGDWVKVFVTGATGVLGRAAVSALLHDGHAVTGLARSEAKAAELADAGADAIQVSLFDQAGLTEALRGFDAVANLATHMPVGV